VRAHVVGLELRKSVLRGRSPLEDSPASDPPIDRENLSASDVVSAGDLPVVPYNGGEAPIDKERFVNARAEDYWTLRERFEQGEIDRPR
jgi:hypothetical protein